jgi:hypothetical protein
MALLRPGLIADVGTRIENAKERLDVDTKCRYTTDNEFHLGRNQKRS